MGLIRKVKKFFKFAIIMAIIFGAGYLIYNNTDLFVERYTISFDSAGAELEKDKVRVDKDGTVTLPEPTKEGYTFEGWYSQGTKWTSDMPITDDLELVARWTANKYDITFIVDGVETIKKTDYETLPAYGSTPTKASTIDHIEYVFVRWEPEIKEVTKETTYTAIFVENIKKNTITITSNIAEAGEQSGSGEYLHKAEATISTTVNTGYRFLGWYDEDNNLFSSTATITIANIESNINLTAKFEIITHNITFIVNDIPTVIEVQEGKIPEYDGTPTKSSSDPYVSYEFAGWSPSISTATEDTTYTAIFNEILTKHKIQVYISPSNNAGYIIGAGDYVHYTDVSLTATPNTGYTFVGWFNARDNSAYAATKTIEFKATTDKSFIAGFEYINYTINYTLNGGSLSGSNPNKYTIDTNSFTLNNPTKSGYEFLGWTGTGYDTPTKNVTITKGNTGNLTFTANWSVINYTITYNLDGGYLSSSNPNKYTIDTNSFTLNNPTKSGYEFLGWTGTGYDTPTKSVTITKGNTGNLTFTANWSKIYTISYNLDGGTLTNSNPNTYTTLTSTFTLNNPHKEGYEFAGWTGTGHTTPTKTLTISKGTTGNLSFTAKWTTIIYKITYNLDGGSVSGNNPTSYTIETPTFTLNNPTHDTGTFIGWTGSGYSTPTTTITIPLGTIGDLSFTANYKYAGAVTLSIKTTNDITLDTITQVPNTQLSQPDINEYGMTGYSFEGWYLDSACTQIFDFVTMPNKNTTIYAKFGDYFLDDGFIPYLNEFDYYINNNKMAEINSFNELVAFFDYCNFNYISTETYFTTTYTTLSNTEISKALQECSFPLVFNLYGTGKSQDISYGVITLDGDWKNNEALITADPNKDYTYTQINSVLKTNYTSNRLNSNTSFNINKVTKTLEVETSNQLVYALEKGYRPICVTGSAAESIYNKAKAILNRICDDTMTDIEKAKAIYDWLIYNVDYDYRVLTLTNDSNTTPYWPSYDSFYAEGVFNNGVAVCDGIAKSLLIMCKIENIPVVRTKGDGHGWNKIYINNTWYGIDATHGDVGNAEKTTIHTYSSFLFTDSYKTSVGFTDVLNDEEISCTTIYDYYDLTTYTYSYYDTTQHKVVDVEFDLKIDNEEELTILFKYIETFNLSALSTFTIEFTYNGSDIVSIIQSAMTEADVSWTASFYNFETTTNIKSYIIYATYAG